ncbi:hypothetical protein BGC_19050 [Burkholderia sp. 3C]
MSHALWKGTAMAIVPAPLAAAMGATIDRSSASAGARHPIAGDGASRARACLAPRQCAHRRAGIASLRFGRRPADHAALSRLSRFPTTHLRARSAPRRLDAPITPVQAGTPTADCTAAAHHACRPQGPAATHRINGGVTPSADPRPGGNTHG